MRNVTGVDVFTWINKVDAICITTNSTVTSRGEAVMGAGVALAAARRWPNITKLLAKDLRTWGNVPSYLGTVRPDGQLDPDFYYRPESEDAPWPDDFRPTRIWSFPVKDDVSSPAKRSLVLRSAKLLCWEHRNLKNQIIALPRPGCGVGGLNYYDVEPLLDAVFEDFENQVWVVTNEAA